MPFHEIIFYDDATNDGTLDVLRKYPVRIIESDGVNKGIGYAQDILARAATGDWHVYPGSDDWLELTYVEEMTKAYNEAYGDNPNIFYTDWIAEGKKTYILKDYTDLEMRTGLWKQTEYPPIYLRTCLIRADLIRQAGGWNPNMRVGDDLEFILRASYFAHWKHVPLILYHFRPGSIHAPEIESELFASAREWLRSRNMEGSLVFKVRENSTDTLITNLKHEKLIPIPQPEPGKGFIDVGAHIGAYTCRMAEKGIPVLAIEPDPGNYALLVENIAMNVLKNVQTLPYAVSDYDGTGYLSAYKADGTYGANTGTPALTSNENGNFVQVRKLDSILFKEDRDYSVMKIDVEGNELRVLKGGVESLKRIEVVVVEVHDWANPGPVDQFLKDHGYGLEIIQEDQAHHTIARKRQALIAEKPRKGSMKCPRCGGSSITTFQHGSRTDAQHCSNCGTNFMPEDSVHEEEEEEEDSGLSALFGNDGE